MRIGQTSAIVFISKLVGSALGFIATLYFARKLGAEVLGIYALILTIINWLSYAAGPGIGGAMTKRISEGEEQKEYFTAAALLIFSIAVVLAIGIMSTRLVSESYVDGFNQYVDLSVSWFIVSMLFILLFFKTVFALLVAQRMVHIKGLLQPVSVTSRSTIQIGLVFAGYNLLGMLVGWMIGGILVGTLGLYWVHIRPARPAKRHFKSILEYAKYNWLSGLESRIFNQVDILLLGVFVSNALVGVYSVAWTIAKFLELFSAAIKGTLFPEISHKSDQESNEAISGMVEDALAYNGLIALPGLIGGFILAERLLRLYGPEFRQGATVLALLIFATLIYSYQSQLLNTLNAIDRPDIAFRINLVFIGLNAVLNVILIWQFGIEGAAVATAFSAVVGLGMSYHALNRLIDFRTPVREPLRQVFSALVMGGIVWATLEAIETTGVVSHNVVIVLGLVSGGSTVYFLILLTISPRFRDTVNRNLPLNLPYLS